MPKLQAQVQGTSSLATLSRPTEQLAADLDAYEAMLQQILIAVETHQK